MAETLLILLKNTDLNSNFESFSNDYIHHLYSNLYMDVFDTKDNSFYPDKEGDIYKDGKYDALRDVDNKIINVINREAYSSDTKRVDNTNIFYKNVIYIQNNGVIYKSNNFIYKNRYEVFSDLNKYNMIKWEFNYIFKNFYYKTTCMDIKIWHNITFNKVYYRGYDIILLEKDIESLRNLKANSEFYKFRLKSLNIYGEPDYFQSLGSKLRYAETKLLKYKEY